MNAKERFYSGLARETIGKITSNKDNWTSFLVTMSRNYEFNYPEQVMIYAQRPNATFCKPYDEWNDEKYRRYVRRGSTGIALFVTNRDKPYLRYVFDVADTGVRRSSPELKPWEVTEENRAYVMEAMERSFGVAADGLLEAQRLRCLFLRSIGRTTRSRSSTSLPIASLRSMMNLTSKWLLREQSQTAYPMRCTADWLRTLTTTSSMRTS